MNDIFCRCMVGGVLVMCVGCEREARPPSAASAQPPRTSEVELKETPSGPIKIEPPAPEAEPEKTYALDFCDVDVTWRPYEGRSVGEEDARPREDFDSDETYRDDLVERGYWHSGEECGAGDEPPCMTSPDGEMLVCLCKPWSAGRKDTVRPVYEHKESRELVESGQDSAVFYFWEDRAKPPRVIELNQFIAERSQRDFSVAEEDLDLDGNPELMLSIRGNYNSIGYVYMHRVILDGKKRDRAQGLYLFQSGLQTPQASGDFYAMHQILLDDAPRGCLLMAFSFDSTGNDCGGCTAGGVTQTSYTTYRYNKGSLERVDTHVLGE